MNIQEWMMSRGVLQGSFEKRKTKCIPLTSARQKGASVCKKKGTGSQSPQIRKVLNTLTEGHTKRRKNERFLVYL